MGMHLTYTTRESVTPAARRAIERAAERANGKQSWVLCEPLHFYPARGDGRLAGSSKLNLLPAPDELAGAAPADSDDNDIHFLVRQLCRWSKKHRLTWELMFEGELLGAIADGRCEPGLWSRIDGFASLGEILGEIANMTDDEPPPPTLRIWPEPD